MAEYECTNVKTGRKKTITTKNKLKGNIIFVGGGKVYQSIPKRGGRCGDIQSAKIAPVDIVRNAILLSETWKRESQLSGQF